MISLICGIKKNTNELIKKTETDLLTDIEHKLTVTKVEMWHGGEINQELGMNIHTLLYIRQMTNKDLLYSTGNSTQYSVITHMRKESKK